VKKILEITSYPPPRAGWGMRVYFLKKHLEQQGHCCVVLNIGTSRAIPSPEYETVLSGWDYLRKVWRFSRRGFVAHVHVNGDSPKGFVLAITAELANLLAGRRCFLTFHAGPEQKYFPRTKYPWLFPMFWLLFTIPSRIICNSEAVKAKIAGYGIAPGKIVPIPAFSRQYLDAEPASLGSELEAFYGRFQHVLFSYLNVRPEFYPNVLVAAYAALAAERSDVGLVLCGIAGYQEAGLWTEIADMIAQHRLESRIMIVNDLDHDQFLTALRRSAMYVRTPKKDGVASSVLEALSIGVPVVAAENGARPAGVVTYEATDAAALRSKIEYVLEERDEVVASLVRPEVRDTLNDEAELLIA
jgi:glycosyltransferase involved in cell wall biosynthesis